MPPLAISPMLRCPICAMSFVILLFSWTPHIVRVSLFVSRVPGSSLHSLYHTSTPSHTHTHTLSLYYPHPALLPLSISLFLFALVPPLTSNKLHSHVPTCAFHLSLLHLPRNVSIFAPKPSCGQRQSTNAIIGHPNPRHHLRPSKPDTAALRGFGSCDAFYRCP